jgi:hypothetical protein
MRSPSGARIEVRKGRVSEQAEAGGDAARTEIGIRECDRTWRAPRIESRLNLRRQTLRRNASAQIGFESKEAGYDPGEDNWFTLAEVVEFIWTRSVSP